MFCLVLACKRTSHAGSMHPKVEAACEFVLATGKRVLIGSLYQIEAMLAGHAGTEVCRKVDGGVNTL